METTRDTTLSFKTIAPSLESVSGVAGIGVSRWHLIKRVANITCIASTANMANSTAFAQKTRI